MKILTRYLLRAHIGPFFFALVTLTGVILINTLAKEMASFAGKGIPVLTILEFFVLSLPANLALTLPMSVLVAVLYTFSTLAAENEIMALRANGIDLRRYALPLVFTSILISAGMIWFNNRVLSESNYRWRMLMSDVAQARPLTAWEENFLNPISDNTGSTPYYLEAERLDRDGGRMYDVAIYDVGSDQITRTIVADSGLIVQNTGRTDMLLTLFDGEIREVNFSEPGNLGISRFEKQVMRLSEISRALERSTGSQNRAERDMTIQMMEGRIDTLRTEQKVYLQAVEDTTKLVEAMSVTSGVDIAGLQTPDSGAAGAPAAVRLPNIGGRDPREYAQSRVNTLERDIRSFQVEIQKKFAIAVAALVYVLIGVPIALRFPHGGIGMVIAVSLSIFGIYYVGLIGGETLADRGYMAPVLSMWLTNFIFGALGIVGYLLLGREHGTSRGGPLGELIFRLRQRFDRNRSTTES